MLLAAIAPNHDVLHVKCTTPGQCNYYRYAFDCETENSARRGKTLALQRFELDARACIASFTAETVGTLRQKRHDYLRRICFRAAPSRRLSVRTMLAMHHALFDMYGAARPGETVLETLEIPWPTFDANGKPVEGSEVL